MKRIPEASAKRGTNYVTIQGVTTYASRAVTGAINWKATKRPIINTKRKPWEKVPSYLDSVFQKATDKIVDAFGMNNNYIDHFESPYKD